METRRMVFAVLAAFAAFVTVQVLVNLLFPPAATDTGSGAATGASGNTDAARPGNGEPDAGAAGATSGPSAGTDYVAVAAEPLAEPIFLGGGADAQTRLRLRLAQRGASVSHLWLWERRPDGRFVHRVDYKGNEPYQLLAPVEDASRTLTSFATSRVRVEGRGEWPLGDLTWELVSCSDREAVFGTLIGPREASGAARPLLRIRKSYTLEPGTPIVTLRLAVENLSADELTVTLSQDGPIGVPQDDTRNLPRRLFVAFYDKEGGVRAEHAQRDKVASRPDQRLIMGPADPAARFAWSALANKYFAVFTRPVGAEGRAPDVIAGVTAEVGLPQAVGDPGDLVARLVTRPFAVGAGQTVVRGFEICAAPKDGQALARIRPEFVGSKGLRYDAVQAADVSCMCTFEPLPSLMRWLLNTIQVVVRNYGLAIIVLVIIVRGALHPLAVFQQKSMYRMQEAMVRIQPKMQAIRERFANDKVRQNQEMMKLWAEENVNPMGSMVGMIPLFIQMPILVALWTALNSDIHLRNAPFDGWWIRDLSQPDALIEFGPGGWDVPILSWLPLIGSWFNDVPSLNLLPLLMGVSMFLQQKYMPKPGMQARLEAARKEREGGRKPAGGMSIEDQLRQQQMMMNIMSVMFPLMFYYMPSGLNLYWMATNVFGICESLVIRAQLEREKSRGPRPPKRPGIVSNFFRRMAEQAEQLQKKADDLSR